MSSNNEKRLKIKNKNNNKTEARGQTSLVSNSAFDAELDSGPCELEV